MILRALTRRLPGIRGAGIIGNWARDFYARRPRTPVVEEVLGLRMVLDPMENVDGTLLFCPQLYDRREIEALLHALPPGGVFVDVGAHIGFYALQAARRVGPNGRVLAIEADGETAARLAENVRLNPGLRVEIATVAVSDEEGMARFAVNMSGNRSGSSLLVSSDAAIEVRCRPLASVLAEHALTRIDAMKLDIEGMEFRVLRRFLADRPGGPLPRVIVLEHHERWTGMAGGDAVALLAAAGYRCTLRTRINRVLVRD